MQGALHLQRGFRQGRMVAFSAADAQGMPLRVKSMLSVGRLCVKTSGRDAGKKCAVVNVIDHTSVLIDGNVRRRRCNVRHLEPLSDVIDIKKDASHEEVESAFKKLKIHSSAPRVARRKKSSAGSKENEQKTGKSAGPEK